MSEKETDPYVKAARIVLAGNEVILEKKPISTADVKDYLKIYLESGEILAQETRSILTQPIGEGNDQLIQAIENWDNDRNQALSLLLFFVYSARRFEEFETMKASAKCCQALLQEPLVPNLDLKRFSTIITEVNNELDKAMLTNSSELPLHQTHLSGVLYNAATFCPQVFKKKQTEDDIRGMHNRFLKNLSLLRGIPPGAH